MIWFQQLSCLIEFAEFVNRFDEGLTREISDLELFTVAKNQMP